jgi:hypothetical protein
MQLGAVVLGYEFSWQVLPVAREQLAHLVDAVTIGNINEAA